MGLDNGFVLKRHSEPEFGLDLAYFRNYEELDSWMRSHCYPLKQEDEEDFCGTFIVTNDVLKSLRSEIKEMAIELMKKYKKIPYFDEHSYPKDFVEDHYDEPFNPAESRSSFAGSKLMHLYMAVEQMIEMAEMIDMYKEAGKEPDFYITFYSSF